MSDSMLWSVLLFSLAYSAVMPKVCASLLNSLSQVLDTSKLPYTVIVPLGPGILSMRYV
jgi:hypothetical protein